MATNMPAVRMHAALVILTLDKLEAAGFDETANIRPTPQELRHLADSVGYPLTEVLTQYGFPANAA